MAAQSSGIDSRASHRGSPRGSQPRRMRVPAPRSWLALMIRHGIPLLLVIAGIVMVILGHGHVSDIQDSGSGSSVFTQTPTDRNSMYTAIGVGAVIVAVMIWMVGWMMRLSVASGHDRDREDAAREYFARTGRWPGERGPGPNRQ